MVGRYVIVVTKDIIVERNAKIVKINVAKRRYIVAATRDSSTSAQLLQ